LKSNGNSVTPKATAQDVETVIPSVLERSGEYFRELWKSLSDHDRNLLQRLVQGKTPTPQDKAVWRKLRQKEIVEKECDRIQVPLGISLNNSFAKLRTS
jgi:hypothetical protein